MSHDVLKDIFDAAVTFRRAIEACDRSELGVSFEDFPLGSCGDTTLLLGRFLSQLGFGEFRYVLGERLVGGVGPGLETHAWLQQGSLVVDITADQFPEFDSPVIVDAESYWHKQWETTPKSEADYRCYDPLTRARLGCIYNLILSKIVAR